MAACIGICKNKCNFISNCGNIWPKSEIYEQYTKGVTEGQTWKWPRRFLLYLLNLLLNLVPPGTPFHPFGGRSKVAKVNFTITQNDMNSDFVDTPHVGHPDLWMFPPLKVNLFSFSILTMKYVMQFHDCTCKTTQTQISFSLRCHTLLKPCLLVAAFLDPLFRCSSNDFFIKEALSC